MIRITDRFTLRRVDGFLNVEVVGGRTVLNASQARDAAEAFAVMAALMTPLDEYEEQEAALPVAV